MRTYSYMYYKFCFCLFLKWDHIMYIVLQLFWTEQLWYGVCFHVRHESVFFFFFSSYIIVGCTVNYVSIPLLLDIWVVWNVSDLEHRLSSSKDAAFLVGPLGPGCFLTLIAWGQEVVSPSLPPLAHPPTIFHEKPSFEHYVSFCDSLPFLVTHCFTPHHSPSFLQVQDFSF